MTDFLDHLIKLREAAHDPAVSDLEFLRLLNEALAAPDPLDRLVRDALIRRQAALQAASARKESKP